MKIKRLDIKAYGHFTDYSLNLSSELPGLHIIYGPNGTGKSTSLRALKGLLYGIDSRTPDNFLHEYKKLLIGGELENGKGKSLSFWRRKKPSGDLLAYDDSLMDASVLNDFLAGVGAPLFDSLFGITHETLVSGGQDILEQKGDVGQALFSAGAGLSSLHGIIESLDNEGTELFKPGGSKPEINKTAIQFSKLNKEIRDLSLSGNKWKEQMKLLETITEELDKVEQDRAASRAELERLKRVQRAMSNLFVRRELSEKLNTLGSMAHLPGNFLALLSEIRGDLAIFGKKHNDAVRFRNNLSEKISSCSVREDLLEQAETIEALYQRLGARLQAKNDRPGINDKVITGRAEAEMLLKQAVPDLEVSNINDVRPHIDKKQVIFVLGHSYTGHKAKLDRDRMSVENLQRSIDRTAKTLSTLPEHIELSGLISTVKIARKAGDIDQQIRSLDMEIDKDRSAAEIEASRLVSWNKPANDLLSLPVPSVDTVNKFDENLRKASDSLRKEAEAISRIQEKLSGINAELKEMEKNGTIPTLKDISQARESRDQLWQLVRKEWLEKADIKQDLIERGLIKALPEAYEDDVKKADEVSDNLHTESKRAHKYASLSDQADEYGKELILLGENKEAAAKHLIEIEKGWVETWQVCGINPLTPPEMRGWLERAQEIRRILKVRGENEQKRLNLIEQRQLLLNLLTSELQNIGKDRKFQGQDIEPVIAYAEEMLLTLKDNNDNRRKLDQENENAQGELQPAGQMLLESESIMAHWQEEWKNAMAGIHLSDKTSPEEAVEVLNKLGQCMETLREVEKLQERLDNIDQSAKDFEADVKIMVDAVAPEIKDLPLENAVARLSSFLKEARDQRIKRDGIHEQMETVEEEIRLAQVELERANNEMDRLKKTALCETDEQLDKVESVYREFEELRAKKTRVEDTLTDNADGVSLEELDRQSQEIEPDKLPGHIETLERRLELELDPEINALSESKGETRNILKQMDGSGKAAEKEEEAQQALSKVRRLADHYIRLRLASLILKREVDQYRQQNQDPILKIAARYFSELTLGAYSGLKTDTDDNDKPILVGICPDNTHKLVEQMSSGTRDQLFLALRLATLEWRLEKHEAMPFIADDILVNFDDNRSSATLQALSTLAEKNQVILFTHHKQVVESAKALNMNGRVHVHSLPVIGAGALELASA
ncbi:MAG: AAA family ATPase [Nitrospira sp.]|nr:AAA family ATPase [Nitrospira sp.]